MTARLDDGPWFSAHQQEALGDFLGIFRVHFEPVITTALERGALRKRQIGLSTAEVVARQLRRNALIERGVSGDWAPYEEYLKLEGAAWATMGLGFPAWLDVTRELARRITPALVQEHLDRPERLSRALLVMQDFLGHVGMSLSRGYTQAAEEGRDKAESRLAKLSDSSEGQAAVREQQPFDRFFTLSLDLLCIAGVDGYLKRVNPAFEAFGYPISEFLSRPYLDFVHPDDRGPTATEVANLAAGITTRFVNRVRTQAGAYRWIAWTSAPDASGLLYSVGRDITEMKVVEEQLTRAKDAAHAAGRELETFSYSVAHDLRAPLRAMNGFAQVVLADHRDRLDADGVDALNEIRQSAVRMGALIDALLSLSRVNRSELKPEWTDLTAVAQAQAAMLESAEPGRAVRIEIQEGLRALLDPLLARALIDNLLSNAWKFTSKVENARIELGATGECGDRTFYLRDNGAGFDMAYAGKLFTPFQRLHAAADFPGTGIGLATAQRIVRRHGGRLWAESAVARGATFYFTVPSSSEDREQE